ncbi:MAG: DUF2188 domain-containing protein [Verrucomicrobia bacterium]|nr:DUF2188 domain-containing protein [Verrucomicrobiota bacterium]
MNRKVYDIAKGHDGEWKGTLRGASRPSVSAPTKAQALERTVEIAKNASLSQVVIHKENGVIQNERTYGADPRRFPG